jgi:hypothetical protein
MFEEFKIHAQKMETWHVFTWKCGSPVTFSHHFPEAAQN